MATRVAINGFGRIGMIASKIMGKMDDMELVAINATMTHAMLEYLLKYDSVHGGYDAKLVDDHNIRIGKHIVRIFHDRDPANLHFAELGADVVLECTGKILTTEKAQIHIDKGVKKVVFSAPAKDDTPTFVMGVNHTSYNGEKIISNASCTTNALAPLVKVVHNAYGIQKGIMTTVHSYTNDQNILDVKHASDPRRARAAALNIIPTSTGAAKAIGLVMPEMIGKLNGFSLRVPTPDVSVVDLNVLINKSVTKDEVNELFKHASEGEFKGYIEYDADKRVSTDFVGSTASSIFVPDVTQVVDGNMIKVVGWYDNEWGYSSRLVDMARFVSTH
jgi:glyceraldehyde 3-phosphate dehydrogenase